MRYSVALDSCRFLSKRKNFAIYSARNISLAGELNGWAYLVFYGKVPQTCDGSYSVWGDWQHSDKYGWQLNVRTFIHFNQAIPPITEIDESLSTLNDSSQSDSKPEVDNNDNAKPSL